MSDEKAASKALHIRRKVKAKKPEFIRYESWRYSRLNRSSWRRQKGLDNKVRLKMKGWEVSPSVGFRGPRVSRHLHPSGYREVIVHNPEDLEGVDPKKYAVRIAHTVGTRKRMLIIGKTEELGLRVLNPVSEIAPSTTVAETAEEEGVSKKAEAQALKEGKKAEKEPKEDKKKKTKGEPKSKKKKDVKADKGKK